MILSDFTQRFHEDNAEIVVLDEHIAAPGTYTDFFVSYCFFKGELYSLNVSYPVVPYYRLHAPELREEQEANRERLFLNRYKQTESGYEIAERIELGGGEDPRVVSNGEHAYAVIIAGNPLLEAEMLLYDFVEQRLLPITVDAPELEYGKNWQPFLMGEQLFCVHQLTPFRVLEIDVTTGVARIVREIGAEFNMPAMQSFFGDNFPMFRGGSNAIVENETVFGLGRASPVSYRHAPFFWSNQGDSLNVAFTTFFSEFYRRGYNIIDPTCLFVENGDTYLGLCCTERDWAHTQLVSNFLIVFPNSGAAGDRERLSAFFDRRQTTERMSLPNLDRHLFFCLDMPSAVKCRAEYGARVSEGERGHIVYGPYIGIDRERRYVAELSYFARTETPIRQGVFEIVAMRNSSDFAFLGTADLAPTGGQMSTARIAFDTTGNLGASLEFRVFVEADVDLAAFHIRTWREGGRWLEGPSLPVNQAYPWAPIADSSDG